MKNLKMLLIIVLSLIMVIPFVTLAQEEVKEPYFFILNSSGGANNPAWTAARRGFEDACEELGIKGLYLNPADESRVSDTLYNLESAIPKNPDCILVSIANDDMFDKPIKKAIEKGILVIGVNTDDSEGAKGNDRQAFIGSSDVTSAYKVIKESIKYLPKPKPLNELKVLIGVEIPGIECIVLRDEGYTKFMEENNMSYDVIEIGSDRADMEMRMIAYLSNHQDVDIIVTHGLSSSSAVARACSKWWEPGEKVIASFDLNPDTIEDIKKGWIQLIANQPMYMQGYLPVLIAFWKLQYEIGPIDIDTGVDLVDKNNIEIIQNAQKKLIYR